MGIKTWVVVMALGVTAVTSLAGCKAENDRALGSTECDVAAFEFLIGQNVSALEGVTVPEKLRVVEDGSPVTMDFHEDRLNVVHDADGVVLKVSCG